MAKLLVVNLLLAHWHSRSWSCWIHIIRNSISKVKTLFIHSSNQWVIILLIESIHDVISLLLVWDIYKAACSCMICAIVNSRANFRTVIFQLLRKLIVDMTYSVGSSVEGDCTKVQCFVLLQWLLCQMIINMAVRKIFHWPELLALSVCIDAWALFGVSMLRNSLIRNGRQIKSFLLSMRRLKLCKARIRTMQ